MADEVTYTVELSVNKNDSPLQYPAKSFVFDMAGTNRLDNTQNIGTSAENVYVGDAGSNPLVFAENFDATNYVELGYDSGGFVSIAKIMPGDPPAVIRLPNGFTLQARANTGACNVRFIVIPS